MEEIIKELTSLEKQISDAKRNLAVQEGRKEEALKSLKDNFELDNIESAKKEREARLEELKKFESSIQDKFKQLKEKYDW